VPEPVPSVAATRIRGGALAATATIVVAEAFWLDRGLPNSAAVSDAGAILVATIAAACCADVARRHPARTRRFWLLMAATMALAAAGRLLWTVGRITDAEGDLPNTPLIGLVFTMGIVSGTAALLSFQPAPISRIGGVRAVLDGLIVGLSLVPIGWVLVLQNVSAAPWADPLRALGMAYPMLDLAQLTVLVAVAASARSMWGPLALIGASLAMRAVADTVYVSLVAQGIYQPGDPLDVCWPFSYLLVALATRYPPQVEIGGADDPAGMPPAPWWRVVLPYLPVGGAIVSMVLARRPTGSIPTPIFVTAMALLAVLAVRQGLAAYENNQLARRMRRLAYEDHLTELPNRLLFNRRLRRAIREERPVAVLLLDLDGFKQVNDRFGHASGDALLRRVAGRMREAVGSVGVLARIGGDEFAVLVEPHADGGPERLAQRMLTAVRPSAAEEEVGVHPSASIGIAEYGRQHAGHADLLRDADIAMYAAKAAGKSAYRICTPALREAAVTRAELIAELRQTLDEGRHLELAYQPIIDVTSGSVRGAEALVRWRHPRRGLLEPDLFLPLAEESGLAAAVDRWVMQEACRAAVGWQDLAPGTTVAVNIAPTHLRQSDVVAAVAGAMSGAGLAPQALTLELTETALIDDTEIVLERLRELRQLGVRIAIDDFGTGYSSLSYLHRIPATALKIDRSFMARFDQGDERAVATIEMVSRLAAAFDLVVVAEGVETEAQHRAVVAIGCPQAQGFLYGRPGSLADLREALQPA
jgi:diguanylate cyclase (GGDEF)-like protein